MVWPCCNIFYQREKQSRVYPPHLFLQWSQVGVISWKKHDHLCRTASIKDTTFMEIVEQGPHEEHSNCRNLLWTQSNSHCTVRSTVCFCSLHQSAVSLATKNTFWTHFPQMQSSWNRWTLTGDIWALLILKMASPWKCLSTSATCHRNSSHLTDVPLLPLLDRSTSVVVIRGNWRL